MNEVNRSDIPREHFQGINVNVTFTSKRRLILPYAGEKGCSIVRFLEKQLKQSQKFLVLFNGTELSSNFNVKDPVPFTEKHDVFIDQFVQLKGVMRTMLVNVLEDYMSVYRTITVAIICLI